MAGTAVMPNFMPSPAMDQIVTKLVPISRRLYECSAFTLNLCAHSGVFVDPVYHVTQRHRSFTVESQFGRAQDMIIPRQSKGRREYFFRLTGTREQVAVAREIIAEIASLKEIKDNHITLKMDVSFADHSFIIGRLGKNIQMVMRSTDTHIHFPDSNRNNQVEKSNQVSVAGEPDSVLKARKRIRDMLPVSFVFVVDKADYVKVACQYDGNEGKILEKLKREFEPLQNEYSMTINWLPVWGRCAMVTVRGRRSNFHRIREGLLRLMDLLQPNKKRPVVYLGLEVSPHYLSYVLGPNDIKIRYLQERTNSKFQVIATRNERAYHIPTIRIFGQIDNVFEAWTGVMDLLPATLLIDVSEVPQSWHDAINEEERRNWSNDTGIAVCGSENSQLLEHPYLACLPSDILKELGELKVVPLEALASALIAARKHDRYDATVAAMRTTVKLICKINDMLYDYDISLLLRLNRDSRQWKIVARGPEGFVNLLMDVYRALTLPNVNPLAFVKAAASTAKSPIRYADLIKSEASNCPTHSLSEPMDKMVLDQFAAIVDEGSADSSGIVRSKVLMHQKQQTSVLQRTLYDEIGSNLERTNQRIRKHDSSFNQNSDLIANSECATSFGGYELSEGTCRTRTVAPVAPVKLESLRSCASLAYRDHTENNSVIDDSSLIGSSAAASLIPKPQRTWTSSPLPSVQMSSNRCSDSIDSWEACLSDCCSPISDQMSPQPKPMTCTLPFDGIPHGRCVPRATATSDNSTQDVCNRELFGPFQPHEQLVSKFNELSVNNEDSDGNEWRKNIANLAVGAGRRPFKSSDIA
ncbi:uncharacterized protein LOC111249808 [Varroa destructor]|uniref:K Homology domain-containing protein n=1 Tax=Varroa destructor TaxID=109461 RepID=A0A7M7K162_VARDE|nr:uncharacterized protein LOC111249808 [Varroa destructor]